MAIVKLLIERDNVDVASEDNRGETPLSQAVRNQHKEMVELLRSRTSLKS